MCLRLRPDLVLMDLGLLKMDGLEASRRIMAEWPEACIIALSMYAREYMELAAQEAGIREYVSKSDSLETLLEVMRRVASDGNRGAQAGD